MPRQKCTLTAAILNLKTAFCFHVKHVKAAMSVTMDIFRKKNLFKSFVKVELSYVVTLNLISTAENCMEK